MNSFAENIMRQKYSWERNGSIENWENISFRVSKHVMKAVGAKKDLVQEVYKNILNMKFIPAGRYLHSAGKPYHQVQNCIALRAEDSREGWADLMNKAANSLLSGAGIGIDYSDVRPKGRTIRRTGGVSTGTVSLMQSINEIGRCSMQGGSRRSAIWAGLNWSHGDVFDFITAKDWKQNIKDAKELDYNFPAALDGTNISVQLDDEFFRAYEDDRHPKHTLATQVYWKVIEGMCRNGEPGFSVDLGENRKDTLRNAPLHPDTNVMTVHGYQPIRNIIGEPTLLWTGKQWAKGTFKKTYSNVQTVKVTLSNGQSIKCDPSHPFMLDHIANNGTVFLDEPMIRRAASELKEGDRLSVRSLRLCNNTILDNIEYAYGFVFGDGSIRNGRGELSVHSESKQKCFDIAKEVLNGRFGSKPNRFYFKSDSDSKVQHDDLSFVAGWFDADGCYTRNLLRLSCKDKDKLLKLHRFLSYCGINSTVRQDGKSGFKPSSICHTLTIASESLLDFKRLVPTVRIQIDLPENYVPYRPFGVYVKSVEMTGETSDVYCCDVGVDEHCFMAEGVLVSNCTEFTSEDDSDICNLGSINLANISSLDEMEEVVESAVAFLLAGTIYSDVPYAKVDQVRSKNRKIGLGLMGVHEFLLKRGKQYGDIQELIPYLQVYQNACSVAKTWADTFEINAPKRTRAIAPTGSIGIIAETTTGIEPIFCVAYKRRFLKGDMVNYQYVVDPTAKRLIEQGVSPEVIEDAYDLSNDIERRIRFQAEMQEYVDMGISSTINLPQWGSEGNNENTIHSFGEVLLRYLPRLRGITAYPDGGRSGQPLSPVTYKTAMKNLDQVFVEQADVCEVSKKGSCG